MQRINHITTTLQRDLASLLTSNLHAPSFKRTINHKNLDEAKSHRDSLLECFRTYEALRKVHDGEEVVRRELVRPWVIQNIHRDVLNAPQTPRLPSTPVQHSPLLKNAHLRNASLALSEEGSLAGLPPEPDLLPTEVDGEYEPLRNLYNKILAFIAEDCNTLLDVTDRRHANTTLAANDMTASIRLPPSDEQIDTNTPARFQLFVNVIWDELAHRLAAELGHIIFAAGRPDVFHKVSRPVVCTKSGLYAR